MQQAAAPLPFNVITGFLGAGKTTLLNRLLKHPGMDGVLVIINEFGEVGIDHALVEASTDEVIELASGCLCCALRGDLVETLVRLLQEHEGGGAERFSRIVVETSGLADPAPVLHSVMAHEWLARRLRIDGVIAVADAMCGKRTLDEHPEAVKQVAVAERIVITKADMEGGGRKAVELAAVLRAINPTAAILPANDEGMTPETLFDAGPEGAGARRWLGDAAGQIHHHGHEHAHGHEHGHGIESLVLTSKSPITPRGVDIFIDLLRANFGASLLRVKGLVMTSGDVDRPLVIHGVQHVFHPPERLPEWPGGLPETTIVVIAREGVGRQVEELFAAIADPLSGSGAAAGDDTLSLLPDGDA